VVFVDVPVLCGHRGSGRGEGENTLESFRAAVAAGLPWVEVDARANADGVLVAAHEAVAAGGAFVSELSSADTEALGIMRVADLLEDLPRAIGVNVELKTALEDAGRPRALTTAALAADLLAPHSGRRPLLVSSFDPSAPVIFGERAPGIALGLLTWRRFPLRKAIPAAVHLGFQVVAPHIESLGLRQPSLPAGERPVAESIRAAHEAGLQVVAWCPAPEEQPGLIAAGVDCLIVDEVAR
jgi:glycerophosphoryl diester phosphodiesterase